MFEPMTKLDLIMIFQIPGFILGFPLCDSLRMREAQVNISDFWLYMGTMKNANPHSEP